MRAERIDIKKRDWVETDCQNCGSSKYTRCWTTFR